MWLPRTAACRRGRVQNEGIANRFLDQLHPLFLRHHDAPKTWTSQQHGLPILERHQTIHRIQATRVHQIKVSLE